MSYLAIILLALGIFFVSLINVILGPTGGMLILLIASLLPISTAIFAHTIVSMVSSFARSVRYWKHIDWKSVIIKTVLGVPGYIISGTLIIQIPELYIYIILISYYAIFFGRNKAIGKHKLPDWVTLNIATSLTPFIGGTGIIVSKVFYLSDDSRSVVIGTFSTYLFFHHLPKLFLFSKYWNDLEDAYLLLLVLVVCPIVGTIIGGKFFHIVTESINKGYILFLNYIFLGIICIKLLTLLA